MLGLLCVKYVDALCVRFGPPLANVRFEAPAALT